jgi:hypothetical protein
LAAVAKLMIILGALHTFVDYKTGVLSWIIEPRQQSAPTTKG